MQNMSSLNKPVSLAHLDFLAANAVEHLQNWLKGENSVLPEVINRTLRLELGKILSGAVWSMHFEVPGIEPKIEYFKLAETVRILLDEETLEGLGMRIQIALNVIEITQAPKPRVEVDISQVVATLDFFTQLEQRGEADSAHERYASSHSSSLDVFG